MKSFKRLTALCGLLLLIGTAAFAQGTTATLTGTVTQDGQPLPGVTVTASSPSMQGTRVGVTGDNGGYVFQSLPPGQYTVTFEMSGMQTVTEKTQLSLAQTSKVNAEMRLSAVAEAITVTASAPAVLETSTVAANFTSKQVDDLPVGRNITQTALLAPGVAPGLVANQLQISGAPAFDNLILVNGVVVNENLRAQIHNLFIEDAIQETTVLTGGISAEYGRFTGGVVSTLTKSGGNQFSGSFRDSLTNSNWRNKTPWPTEADHLDNVNEVYEATLGGYVLRDRLWFFGGGRQFETATQRFTVVTNLPYAFGDEEQRLEGKLTGQVTSKHNLVISYIDVTRDLVNNSFGNIMDTRSLYQQSQPNTLGTVMYNGVLTPNFLIEAAYAEKDFTFVGGGAPTRDRVQGTLMVDNPTGRRYWSPTFCGVCTDEGRNNDSWLLKGSYFLSTRSLGNHTIIVGAENFAEQRIVNNHQSGSDFRILANIARVGNDIFPVLNSGSIIQWNPILFQSPGSDLATRSLFVNNRWELSDRWSFNVGLRYDQNDATDSFGNTVSDDSEFSPRLGATYDIRGDGRHKVNATYGRYVSKVMDGNVGGAASPAGNPAAITFFWRGPDINTGSGPYLTTDQVLTQLWAAFDAASGGMVNLQNYANHPWLRTVNIPGQSTIFPESIVSPSMDEFTIGYGSAFARNAYFRADLIAREWNNFYAEKLTLDTITATLDRSFITNSDEVVREYRGVQVQASWRPSRFNLGGSYTWSTLEGNDQSEGVNVATIPNQTLSGFYPQYLGYEQRAPMGSLDGDIRHRAKVWAGYDIPLPSFLGRLNFSALHTYISGSAYAASGTIDASGRNACCRWGVGANPGYSLGRLGDSHTYFFTDRDAFRTDALQSTDLALNYSIPLWRVELFAQAEVFNVFDNDTVVTPDTTVQTKRSNASDQTLQAFNPFTTTPVEGVHWRKGPNFGKAVGVGSYQIPREYQFSVGLRF